MTIAQVFTATWADGSLPTPDALEQLAKRQMAVDGCEGIYMFGDRATGESISFTLWRDDAAMNAAAAYQEEEIENAKNATPAAQISAPRIYQLLASG